ncbi:MAG: hypothetical protein EBS53_12365, partial [Bacteroidetes bacterium]|nr:hypothetical protein [Bacteroidota bacterium]
MVREPLKALSVELVKPMQDRMRGSKSNQMFSSPPKSQEYIPLQTRSDLKKTGERNITGKLPPPARSFVGIALPAVFAILFLFQCVHAEKPKTAQQSKNEIQKLIDAAEKGDGSAQLRLAYCYETGTDVARDELKAIEWYVRAFQETLQKAENGDAFSQWALGKL